MPGLSLPVPTRVRLASTPIGSAPLLAALLAGCVSYEALPIEPLNILHELDSLVWTPSPGPTAAKTSARPSPAQLAAFAVNNNPDLRTVRARVGVSQALLVQAGLLPDVEIGWDGMDALASTLVEGTSSSVDFVSGFGLSIPLPRPGELDAREGSARWRLEEARCEVLRVEWELVRSVYLAYEDVRAAQSLLSQNEQLTQLVRETDDYFQRAKDAGVSTAIESSLAHGDLLSIRARSLGLAARVRAAKQGLNTLLGLPPNTALELSAAERRASPDLLDDAARLAELAVQRRPDLAQRLAAYHAAEDDVRLEIARQYPQLSIGTGIRLVPGFLSHFNRPAIRIAEARREELRRAFEAAVHGVRREIYDEWSQRQETRGRVDFLESQLLPNAEQSVRLAARAFAAGEATLVQILNVQRAVVDARMRHTEALAALARGSWRLRAAAGLLLHEHGGASPEPEEKDESAR